MQSACLFHLHKVETNAQLDLQKMFGLGDETAGLDENGVRIDFRSLCSILF